MSQILVKYGDAIKLMREIPDESIDLVLTDPPYGLGQVAVITRNGGKFGKTTPLGKSLVDNPLTAKGVHWKDWIPIAYEKLKPTGILITFCQKRDISYIYDFLESELNMVVRHVAVWAKTNPPAQARKVKWMDAWEPIIIATKNRGSGHHYNWRGGQHRDVIETPICMGKERTPHPTQKPLKLIETLIRWWSFEEDWVLDPFAGSGTTGVACQKLNRNCIMFEIDEKWKPIIEKRLKLDITRLDEFFYMNGV